MIKIKVRLNPSISDKQKLLGLTSLKKFDCPHCKIEITFRISSQVVCYKCGKPLADANSLLNVLTTRILYHNDDLF